MFRKIISNLPFSPALVGQLGFYAKRLRKEETTRRLGLIFVVLALIVQSIAVFQPPESANAANYNDMVPGGVGTSINNFLRPYDANKNNLRDVMNYVGITRSEIAATQYTSWIVKDKLSWGFSPRFSYTQGERRHDITNAQGQYVTTVYSRPNKLFNGYNTRIWGWVGHSQKMGWFAIMQNCGNLMTDTVPPPPPPPPSPVAACTSVSIKKISRKQVLLSGSASKGSGATINSYTFTVLDSSGKTVRTQKVSSGETSVTAPEVITIDEVGTYTVKLVVSTSLGDKTSTSCVSKFTIPPPDKCPVNPDLTVEDKDCQPCPGDDTLWIKDPDCAAKIVLSKTATNISRGFIEASTVTAEANNQISYTLTIENTGLISETVNIEENLEDVLEYSTLVDSGGGTLNETTKVLSWPETVLGAGSQQTRTFVIRLLDPIPSTPQGISDESSYDCVMTNTFGNSIDIPVACPLPKIIEQVVTELPQTGPAENILFSSIVLAFTTYFYARTRQTRKEIRLVRHQLNAGAI